MAERNRLDLTVKDFGPIARANIDLRPLTVFVGPSNTGKSYLAVLIYALHKFFSGPFPGRFLNPLKYYPALDIDQDSEVKNLTDKDIESLVMTAKDVIDIPDRSLITILEDQTPRDSYISIQESTAHLIYLMLKRIGITSVNLNNQIAREFGVKDTTQLVRNQVKGGSEIGISRRVSSSQQHKYIYSIDRTKQVLSAIIADKAPLQINIAAQPSYREMQIASHIDLLNTNNVRYQQEVAYQLLAGLSDAVTSTIVSPLGSDAYYLPADRTGIMHAHRTMVRSIISGAPLVGIQRDSLIPQLSGVLADFLQELIALDSRLSKVSSKSVATSDLYPSDVATQIEKNILQGEVVIKSSEVKYPEFFYTPLGWKYDALPLLNSSSMVSELAPVVLYLRHIVKPNNLLIIEEPESHLHPAMQVYFIRYLIAAVKKGVRVMLTTHSEWILDELARLILLSDLPESKRDGIAAAEYALKRDEVGVWLFEPKKRPKGSIVKEISFDSEYAGFRSGFDDVAIIAHNDYAEIVNRIADIHSD